MFKNKFSSICLPLKNPRALSLVELLIGLSIMGIASLVALAIYKQFFGIQKHMQFRETVQTLRSSLLLNLKHSSAWQSTIEDAANASMVCLKDSTSCCATCADSADLTSACTTGQTGAFALKDSSGTVIFPNTTTNASAGFDANGHPCTNFNGIEGSGEDSCPFQINLTWRAACFDCGCTKPQVYVNALIKYNPRSPHSFNINRYHLINYGVAFFEAGDKLDKLMFCQNKLKFYAPDHPGSDGDGCVNGDHLEWY